MLCCFMISMANKNYEKGVRKERKLKQELERAGWIVLRTAGSHGFADLIAMDKVTRKIKFIQVKPDDFSAAEKEKLLKQYDFFKHHPVFLVGFEII